uniref:Uncharacterized protein n=1 Tax=Pyxicephalus adspersus TaxID=30357 RepID=A0AAV3AIX0_PYXAD|nr:TPA: hypothetical protein GDO54_013099 [Pyxicephalus adspersus]
MLLMDSNDLPMYFVTFLQFVLFNRMSCFPVLWKNCTMFTEILCEVLCLYTKIACNKINGVLYVFFYQCQKIKIIVSMYR